MLRQLAGILILLSFLLVKSEGLVSALEVFKPAVTQQANQQDADQSADDEKESKSQEFADEYIHERIIVPLPVERPKKLNHMDFPDTAAVHMAVWGPPPNCVVA